MQSTLDPKVADPHDIVEIVPDVVLVARAEKELSRLAQDAASRRTEPKMASDVFAGASVPPVDTTFRATAVNSQVPGQQPPLARRAMRGFMVSGAHRSVMPRLPDWCDVAAVTHWTQESLDPPTWP